jgi:AraC-like DNA-binding protein
LHDFTYRVGVQYCTAHTLRGLRLGLMPARLVKWINRLNMDILSFLFSRINVAAKVFYSGSLCRSITFEEIPTLGYLHVLRKGNLRVVRAEFPTLELNEPTLLFYPRPTKHRFEVDDSAGAKLVCATIDFGGGISNPLLSGLPDLLQLPLAALSGIDVTLALLFEEAFAERAGRQAAINRLSEYFLLRLLRHLIETNVVNGGVIAGLADARLAKAINAMHEKPEHEWTLEELANQAGMSRARFAGHFREVTNLTPLDYLTDWRISVAQTLLKQGKPMKLVAPMVGYSSAVGLSRVFAKRTGKSVGDWLKEQHSG